MALSFLFLLLLTAPSDTTINGIKVEFTYSPSIFPSSWQVAPINARAESMPRYEIVRTKEVITDALNKYPLPLLKQELSGVYFVRTMRFYDVAYGGTNSENAIYISNDGVKMGYTASYIEQTFHHEFSSILLRNHPTFLDTSEWKKANTLAFDYNDPENGVGSIRKNQSSQDLDTALTQQGFLTQYSLSSIENDINTFAQNLFCPSPDFWPIYENYPRVKKKAKLLIAFYHKINPIFTEEYFRKIREQRIMKPRSGL
jgi:hypothetical protein